MTIVADGAIDSWAKKPKKPLRLSRANELDFTTAPRYDGQRHEVPLVHGFVGSQLLFGEVAMFHKHVFLTLSLAGLLLAATSASAQPPGKPAAARKWEYKVVELKREGVPISGARIEELLNKLGEEGWEYAGTIDAAGAVQLVFKRMKGAAEKPPGAGGATEVKIFALQHADANKLAESLGLLLRTGEGRDLRFSTDARTNSLLVMGSPEDLQVVEAIIARLDEAKE